MHTLLRPIEHCCALVPEYLWPIVLANLMTALSFFITGGWLFHLSHQRTGHVSSVSVGRMLVGLFLFLHGVVCILDAVRIWIPICQVVVIVRLASATVGVIAVLWGLAYRDVLTAAMIGKQK